MSESDEKPFTVNDRRHFTPEGTARETPEPAAVPAEEPVAPPRPQPSDVPGPAGADESAPRRPPPSGPVDFSHFLISLGAQAGALLSGAPAGEGMSQDEAIAHAQSIISILEMLEDKTRGRRTPDEDRLLEGLLFELRMAYVQTRQAGTR